MKNGWQRMYSRENVIVQTWGRQTQLGSAHKSISLGVWLVTWYMEAGREEDNGVPNIIFSSSERVGERGLISGWVHDPFWWGMTVYTWERQSGRTEGERERPETLRVLGLGVWERSSETREIPVSNLVGVQHLRISCKEQITGERESEFVKNQKFTSSTEQILYVKLVVWSVQTILILKWQA